MKISAIEIRKHTFEKIFRGYDPDEVDAFLNSLSQEWERFSSENSLLKMQLEYAEKELAKLKDIESTLFRTLKAAEDTSRMIEREANENAEKRIEESKSAANVLVAEAEDRTNQILKETEDKLRQFKEDFASEIKRQERDFKAIENFRDNLVVQLTSLANNTIDTVDRFEQKYDKESVLNKMDEIKQHVSEIEIPKRPVYQAPREVEVEVQPDASDEPAVEVIMQDNKPEIYFEVIEPEPEVEEEPVAEIEEELPPVAETVVEEKVEQPAPTPAPAPEPEPVEEEPVYNTRRDAAKTAADEMNEALAEMQKVRDNKREPETATNNSVNRPRETNAPKKSGGGGSFFDQI